MTETIEPNSLTFPAPITEPPIPGQRDLEARLGSMADWQIDSATFTGAIALMNLVEGGEQLPEQMNREATDLLLALGIATTTLPQHTRGRRASNQEMNTQAEFDKIIEKTIARLRDRPTYKDCKEVADPDLAIMLRLMDALRPDRFRYLLAHNVGRTLDGMYAMDRIEVATRGEDEATLIAETLDALFEAEDHSFRVDTPPKNKGGRRRNVVVHGSPHEYAVRETGNAAGLVGARLLLKLCRVTLPDYGQKESYEELRKKGHTFPPTVDLWLRTLEATYQAAEAKATYNFDEAHKWLPVEKESLLITEVTTLFQLLRDARRRAKNRWLKEHPELAKTEGSHTNQDLHPNPKQQMLVSAGAKIVRPRITPEQAKKGPASPRATTAWERWKRETLMNAKKHRIRTIILTTIKAVGAVTSGGLDLIPAVLEEVMSDNVQPQWRRNHRERKRINDEFKAARPLMRIVINVLEAEHNRRYGLGSIGTSSQS